MKTSLLVIPGLLVASLAGAQGNVGIGTLTPGSKLQVAGSFAAGYSAVSTPSYILGDNDYYVSYTGGLNGDFYLPPGSAALKGRTYFIKNTQFSSLTIHAADGEFMDFSTYYSATMVLYRNELAQIVMKGNSGSSNATSELAAITASEQKSWNLTGNSDLNGAVHYIGTNNNAPLYFRVNAQKAGGIGLDGNTSLGYYTLNSNSEGANNTTLGYQAMFLNTSGHDNASLGWGSLVLNNGSYNTASGSKGLYNNTTGNNNTAAGFEALKTNTTGNENTAIGSSADVISGELNNATAIGSGAVANASNKVRIGNSAVTVIEGQVAFTFPSDGRYKKNVSVAGVPGLDFILKLKPVSYNFDYTGFSRFIGEKGADAALLSGKNDHRESGFVAQDVEQLVKETGVTFNAVHAPANGQDNYSLSYMHFVIPLVKAVQEQQATINKQQAEIESLKATNARLTGIQREFDQLRADVNKLINVAQSR